MTNPLETVPGGYKMLQFVCTITVAAIKISVAGLNHNEDG